MSLTPELVAELSSVSVMLFLFKAIFCGPQKQRWSYVGADECNEAAILSQTVESQAKDQDQDQKIAGFASSYTQKLSRDLTLTRDWPG